MVAALDGVVETKGQGSAARAQAPRRKGHVWWQRAVPSLPRVVCFLPVFLFRVLYDEYQGLEGAQRS